MNKNQVVRRFIVGQGITFFSVTLVSLIISSLLSSSFLRKELSNWNLDINSKYVKQGSQVFEFAVLENAREIYNKIVIELHTDQVMSYYLNGSIQNNTTNAVSVQNSLLSARSSNKLLDNVGIYFAYDNLLISSNQVLYQKSGSNTIDELTYCKQLCKKFTMQSDGSFFVSDINNGNLRLYKYVSSGTYAKALIFLDYNIDKTVETLKSRAINDEVTFFVINEAGKIIVSTGNGVITDISFADTEFYSDRFENSKSGYYTYQEEIVNFIRESSGWSYISFYPTQMYTTPVTNLLIKLICLSLITLLFSVIIALILSQKSYRQICPIISLIDDKDNTSSPVGINIYDLIQNQMKRLIATADNSTERYQALVPALHDSFVLWLIIQRPTSKVSILNKIQNLGISFQNGHFCLIAVKALPCSHIDQADAFDYDYAFSAISERLNLIFLEKSFTCSFCRNDRIDLFTNREISHELWCLINFDGNKESFRTICNKTVFEQLLQDIDLTYCSFYICTGDPTQQIESLSESIPFLQSGLRYSYIFPEIHYFSAPDVHKLNNTHDPEILDFAKSVDQRLRKRDWAGLNSQLRSAAEHIRRGIAISDVDHYIDILSTECETALPKRDPLRGELLEIIRCSSNIVTLQNELEKLLLNNNEEEVENGPLQLVIKTQEYIHANLTSPQLSLQNAADQVNVTTAYLSHIFSVINGITFVEYVNKEKMLLAGALLIETNQSVSDISQQIGYSTPQYFISRFKNYFGTTPSLYRKAKQSNTEEST